MDGNVETHQAYIPTYETRDLKFYSILSLRKCLYKIIWLYISRILT